MSYNLSVAIQRCLPRSSLSQAVWWIAISATSWGTTNELPSARAVLVPRPPVFDGTLDDPLWRSAPPLADFRQTQPTTGAPGSERTVARLLHDADNLYIGIRCDEAPADILGNDLSHDSRDTSTTAPAQGSVFESDDYLAVTLDPFGRRQEGYYFAVNPAGAWADGLVYNVEILDLSWDTVWFTRTHRDSAGWSAEIIVPFKSIAFNARLTEWRVNIERMLRRKQEIVRWTGVDRQRQVYSLAELGRLRGLEGIRQGLGLECSPYLLYRSHTATPPAGASANGFRSGADVVWHILPSLEATLTINTDFAQTEVDQRQIDLTRFPLFYPEKRDFFLRDEPFFSFGGIDSTTFVPYYSRSIGLVKGAPVGLPFGAKLAGRAGSVTLGLLNTLVDASPGGPRRNLTVGRVAWQATDSSTVGILFTHGDPRAATGNTLVGTDFNLVNNSWLPGRTLIAHVWVMGTHSALKGGNGTAASFEVNYPNDPFAVDFLVRQVDARFDPALGFVQQTGVRDYHLFIDRFWHPNGTFVRDVDFGSHADLTYDLQGRDLAEDADFARLTLTHPAGDNLAIWFTNYADRPLTPFTAAPGVVVAPGFYRWLQGKIQFVSSASRPVSGIAYFRYGDYYNGRQTEEKGSIVWRPDGHWNVTATCDLYQISLPAGHFDVRNLSASISWYGSPYFFVRVLGQFDTQSRTLGMDYRCQWTVAPRRSVFLVINRGYFKDPGAGWRNQGGQQALKVGWTWQF